MSGNYHWKIDFYEHGEGTAKLARVFSIPVSCSDGPGRFFGIVSSGSVTTTRALLELADDLAGKGEVRQSATEWFEKLLAGANRRYATVISAGEVPVPETITALWALQIRNSVSFAAHGPAHAYLHHRQGRNTQFIDVRAEQSTGKESQTLFGEVFSGGLAGDDKMVFTTRELFNYVALHHLQFLMDKKAEPLEAMREELTDVDAKIPIVTAMMRSLKIDKAIRVPAEGKDSIEELVNKTRDTENWLNPPILPAMRGVLDKVVHSAQRVVQRTTTPDSAEATDELSTDEETPHEQTLPDLPPAPPPGQGTITRLFKNIPTSMGGLPSRIRAFITAVPGRSRWVLIGAGALLAILIISITVRVILQSRTRNQAAYTAALETIQERRNEVEASMIYNDEDRAWRALDAARQLVNELPQKSKAQKKTVSDLTAQLTTDAEKLQRIARITPEVVSALSEVSLPSPVAVTLRGEDVLVVDAAGIVAGFPTTGGAGRVLSVVPNRTYSAAAVDNDILYITNGNELFTLSESTLTSVEGPALLDTPPRDMAFWNRRMYVAAPEKNQVIRLSREGAGWGARTNWIETPDPGLNDITAISIDGSVWTAGAGGTIQKFTAGKRDTLSLRRIEPALTSVNDIIVSPTADRLYVFDAAGKRVLLLKKDGTLLTQYVADWKEPRGFTIDEKNKTAYVLDGTTLTKFPLP